MWKKIYGILQKKILYLPGWMSWWVGLELIIGRFWLENWFENWFKLALWISNFLVWFFFGIFFGEWPVPSDLFLLNNGRNRMKPFWWVENDADSSAKPIQDLSDDTLLRPQKTT